MTTPETLVYAGTENCPTPEGTPDGAYRYIYDGENRRVIFARLSTGPEHSKLQRVLSVRPFNSLLDDAGQFALRWQQTEKQMADLVNTWAKICKEQNKPFDADEYLSQLQNNFGQTQIKLDPKYGSSTLNYTPNPTTRNEFIERLQELFPEAQITLESIR